MFVEVVVVEVVVLVVRVVLVVVVVTIVVGVQYLFCISAFHFAKNSSYFACVPCIL